MMVVQKAPGIALERDPWLSARLGRESFHLRDAGRDGESASLGAALEALPSSSFIDAKTSVDAVDGVAGLVEHGFRLIDTNVRLRRGAGLAGLPTSPRARFADERDRDGVATIAERAFTLSRFHLDPLVPKERADRIKRDWAAAYFDGTRGDAMVVCGPMGRPLGFLQLFTREEGVAIDLVAVSPEARGQGLAGEMIALALRELPGGGAAEVGTQLANRSSIRLYESIGFIFDAATYVLHAHRGTG